MALRVLRTLPPESDMSLSRTGSGLKSKRPDNWKPDPKVDSPTEIVTYLFRESERKRKSERKSNEDNDKARVTFMSMAFSIVLAFMLEQFFKFVVGPVLFDKAGKEEVLTSGQKYCVHVLWFAIVFLTFPLSSYALRKVQMSGCRARSVFEDAKILWKLSTKTMVIWSFKDVTVSGVGLLAQQWLDDGADGEPSDIARYWFNDYSETNVVDTFKYFVISVGVTAVALLLALLVGACLQCRSHGKQKNSKALDWVENSPFLLGIGMVQARISVILWYLFPWDAVKSTVPLSVYAGAVRLVCCVGVTAVAVFFMRTLKHRQDGRVPLHHPSHKVSSWWLREYAFELLVRSCPFAFTYQWTQLTYEASFNAMFSCLWPFHYCGESTLWMWAAYSFAFGLVAYWTVPMLQESSIAMAKLDKFYAKTLLSTDKHHMRSARSSDELFANLFSIGLGWAFTNTVRADCVSDITPTCPDEITLGNVLKYLVTLLCFLSINVAGYHVSMAGFRLRSRASKVQDIEEGNCNHLFCEVDEDGDGNIDRQELKDFLDNTGLAKEMFNEAFEGTECLHCQDVDSTEGYTAVRVCTESCPGKSVDSAELVIKFTEIVAAMRTMHEIARGAKQSKRESESQAEPCTTLDMGDIDCSKEEVVQEDVSLVTIDLNANPDPTAPENRTPEVFSPG